MPTARDLDSLSAVNRIRLGNAALARVVEWQVTGLSHELFPQTPAEEWRELAPDYAPTFWSDAGWRIALQTWVVDVDGLTVLVDAGAGNDRRGHRRQHAHPHRPRRLEHDARWRFMGADVSQCPVSRRRAAVVPAHFPGHGGAMVVARGDAFMVDDWLELPPI